MRSRARQRVDWGSKDAATAAYWAQRTAAFHGIVTWSPTIDPEALKTLSMQMVGEAKVRLLLHAWATAPILEGNAVKGAIFESKEGRHAVFAKVVIDTTGDADLIARTHASLRVGHRRGRHPPLHQHGLPARRRRHGAVARLPQAGARRLLRSSWRWAARS